MHFVKELANYEKYNPNKNIVKKIVTITILLKELMLIVKGEKV